MFYHRHEHTLIDRRNHSNVLVMFMLKLFCVCSICLPHVRTHSNRQIIFGCMRSIMWIRRRPHKTELIEPNGTKNPSGQSRTSTINGDAPLSSTQSVETFSFTCRTWHFTTGTHIHTHHRHLYPQHYVQCSKSMHGTAFGSIIRIPKCVTNNMKCRMKRKTHRIS